MDLLQHLRAQARANRLANRRLHEAMRALSEVEFTAPRTGFFPSLAKTLNHILAVDIYYLAALHGEADMEAQRRGLVPAATLHEIAQRQAASDERLIGWCDSADAAMLDAPVAMDRGDHVDTDVAARVLAHLFMHQTHHRGQAHAMLSGTHVKPPQLDEFVLASDAALRVDDLRALGWSEADLLG
ncbi:MAG TPA: DinB family protein [Ideonella sp.]|nr:DinB family protein [Ideonella sp.]